MRRFLQFSLATLVLVAAGCGGSGSAVDNGPLAGANNASNAAYRGPNKGSLSFYVTNSSAEGYDHAWVVLKKVELKLAGGGERTIFSDARGIGLDLAGLHDANNPVYQLLSGMPVPVGTYTGAEITVARQAVFFRDKSEKAMGADFASSASAPDSLISFEFDAPKIIGSGADSFVLDFNLGAWQSKDEKLDPKLRAGTGQVSNPRLRVPTLMQGQVAELKGKSPEFSFVLRKAGGPDLPMHTSSSTGIRNLGPKSKLSNGSWIEVIGAFDSSAKRLEASSITIAEKEEQLAPAALLGRSSGVDGHAAQFQIAPNATRGFAPGTLRVTVFAKGASTLDAQGKPMDRVKFYQALSDEPGAEVQVQGSFDVKQQVFHASEARLMAGPEATAPKPRDPKMQKV